MGTAREVRRILEALVRSGNFVVRALLRIGLVLILLILASAIWMPEALPWLAMVFGVVVTLVLTRQPVVTIIVGLTTPTLRWASFVVGLVFAAGAYALLLIIPAPTGLAQMKQRLTAALIFVVLSYIFLRLANQYKWFRRVLVLSMILITVLFARSQGFGLAPGFDLWSAGGYPNYNPDPTSISRHLYEEDANGTNNHKHDKIKYFDVVLLGDLGDSGKGEFCKEGHIVVPDDWTQWCQYWVTFQPDRHFGILFSGFTVSYGPWGVNPPDLDDERLNNKPREQCLQGLGTLRYQRIQ